MMVEECHGRSRTQAAPGETNITSIRADSKHSNTGPLTHVFACCNVGIYRSVRVLKSSKYMNTC